MSFGSSIGSAIGSSIGDATGGGGPAPPVNPYMLLNTDGNPILNTDGTPLEVTHD